MRIFLLTLITCLSGFANAKSLSLEESKELAKKNSEVIQAAKESFNRKTFERREAIGTALPQLSADATYQNYIKPPVFFGNSVAVENQLTSGITLTQTLWSFGRLSNSLKSAKHSLEAAKIEEQLAEASVELQTVSRYYGVLLAQQQRDIANESLQNARRNVSLLRRKFSRPPQDAILRLESDVASRTTNLRMAEADLERAKLALAQLLSLSDHKSLELTSNYPEQFPKVNEQQLLKQLQEGRTQLTALEKSTSAAEAAAKVYKASNLPTLSALANYSYSGASDQSLRSEDLEESAYVGLNLSWNIWDGGSSNASYKQALSDATSARIAYQKAKEEVEMGLRQEIQSYQALTESLKSSEQAVSLAKRSYNASQRKFGAGQTSVTEINSMEAALVQSEISLATNKYNAQVSLARIRNIINATVGDANE